MKGKSVRRSLMLALVSIGVPATTAAASDTQRPSAFASFEGHSIRLADGWGEAQACTTDGLTTNCYRGEAAMDAAEGSTSLRPARSVTLQPLVECSLPTLKIYRLGSYGGAVLQFTTRGQLFNLASYGFDNDTSSYKIGPCAAAFYDTTSGGGPLSGQHRRQRVLTDDVVRVGQPSRKLVHIVTSSVTCVRWPSISIETIRSDPLTFERVVRCQRVDLVDRSGSNDCNI